MQSAIGSLAKKTTQFLEGIRSLLLAREIVLTLGVQPANHLYAIFERSGLQCNKRYAHEKYTIFWMNS